MKKNYLVVLWTCFYFQIMQAQTTNDTIATIRLDEVIVSVNKVEEKKNSVAQQVEVIPSSSIQLGQDQTTAELLGNTSGVFVQKSQMGGGSPVLRGFEANRIVLVIDGVRMNNLIYRGGHLQNILTMDKNMLDRVEILYGPSSTIYGSDALGGVIHFITRKPEFAESGAKRKVFVNSVNRFSSANNEWMTHLDVNAGNKKFASLTSFTRSDYGDLRGGTLQNPFYSTSYGERPYYVELINNADSLVMNKDRFLQIQSAYTQYDLIQKFSYRPSNRITHSVNAQYSTSSDIPRYDRLTDPATTRLRFAEWYYGPQKRLMASYDLTYLPDSQFFQRINAGVNFQNVEESRHTRRFNTSSLTHRSEQVNVGALTFNVQRISGRHDMKAGLDIQINDLKSTANSTNILNGSSSPLDTRYPDGVNSMNQFGIYFSHNWLVNSKTRITDAVRIGYSTLHSTLIDTTFFKLPYRDVSQKNVVYSGSVGLIHQSSEAIKISALLSTGFRVPNVDDLSKIFESVQGSLIVPNTDLKPEKTISFEMGFRYRTANTSWENTVYGTRLYDAIVTDAFLFNGNDSVLYDGVKSKTLANQNKRKAYILGFNSAIQRKIDSNFDLMLSINYTYGRTQTDTVDIPLDHIPPFYSRLQLTYHYKNFSTLFYIQYNSWKRLADYNPGGEDNLQYATQKGMPAWYTLNWKASWTLNHHLKVQAGVENIADIQYRTFSSGINAPGRNWVGTISLRF